MTELETIKAVRELLGRGIHRWTKAALARAADKRQVDPKDPEAESFCLSGAILHVTSQRDYIMPTARALMAQAPGRHEAYDLPAFNDQHSYEEVLALLDAVIAKLEGEQT